MKILNKMKKNVTLLNAVTSLVLQFLTILSGFIIPKIILDYFGSNINGLVSSIGQFLSYISLLEGGVTGVIMAYFYKPLYSKDTEKISSIYVTTSKFYKKVSFVFLLYTLVLAIVYPCIFKTGYSYIFIFFLTIVLSINLFIQFMFSLTMKTMLNADKKIYVVSLVQSLIVVLNIIVAFVSIKLYPNILFFKIVTSLIYILQPLLYGKYISKHYKIKKNAKIDNNLLKNRWNGFAINIAAFIHHSTDITILTIFSKLSIISIYSVYALVTNGLRRIVVSLTSAITPTIGRLYAANKIEELTSKFDVFEFVLFYIVFLLFSIGGLLITPFVMIYTNSISDANYYQPLFGILIIVGEGLYLIKSVHLSLSYSANKFNEITIHCYIEAIINIIISLLLVNRYGLTGVSIGTIVAMTYRMISCVSFTKRIIKQKLQVKFYTRLLLFSISTVLGVLVCTYLFPSVKYNIFDWLWHSIVYSIVMFTVYTVMSVIFYKKELISLKKYITNK